MKRAVSIAALAAVVIAVTAAARWMNPLTLIGDIKSDEATYVSMALSLVDDGNLTFEKADLDRFVRIYPRGPEGIFLKRDEIARPAVDGAFPFVHMNETPVPATEHLVYGKAFVYPLVAAPFVAIGGVGGLIVFNVVLIVICAACGIRFAQARMGPVAGALTGVVFVGASVLPVYAFWLMPEIFNVTLIFTAYFLWLYKQVAPAGAWRGWHGSWTDLAAAALIGVAIYSKPNHVVMIGPLVLVELLARRWRQAARFTVVAAVVGGGLFAVNLWLTGEWNYQGSIVEDGRKEFYDTYPFDAKGTTFDTRSGLNKVTNDTSNTNTDTTDVFLRLLPRNTWYFFVGRDAGLLPYFAPGLLIAVVWLAVIRGATARQVAVALGVIASALLWLIIAPYTWNGDGGPPGNRYFLSTYPLLLFLLPQGTSALLGFVAAAVGLTFTAQMTWAPVRASTRPWLTVERAPFKVLPVELTLINGLPIALTGAERWRIQVSADPYVLFYYMDGNAKGMEATGQWIAGDATADIIIRTDTPLTQLTLNLDEKYVPNEVTVSLLGDRKSVRLDPGGHTTVTFAPPPGVWYQGSYAEVLRFSTTNGFVPAKVEPVPSGSVPDTRFLGVFVSYHFVTAPGTPAGK